MIDSALCFVSMVPVNAVLQPACKVSQYLPLTLAEVVGTGDICWNYVPGVVPDSPEEVVLTR